MEKRAEIHKHRNNIVARKECWLIKLVDANEDLYLTLPLNFFRSLFLFETTDASCGALAQNDISVNERCRFDLHSRK